MKTIILFIYAFLILNLSLTGQEKIYFQQGVDYQINVTLNDENHSLQGDINIVYTNNSSDKLDFIYFHLWPNAYRNTSTAFAQQKLEGGSTKFYFSDEKSKGGISDLNFNVSGEALSWDYDAKNPDIAIVRLKRALTPGETVTINTPFLVDIPSSFSRLGHVEQSYQLTQWYPKPAVYDKAGWHPMPYLDQGEFYSEFGDFDVKITLPANYVVGASGVLQNQSEIDFLNRKAQECGRVNYSKTNKKSKFPESSAQTKTLHYTADNVHDFAWFADKRFHVLKSEVTLASGKKVDTWAMFTDLEANLWKDATTYLDRSVEFYSEKVGEYPWPHATAVQSALSAGGGMEYPMITVIGRSGDAKTLDIVITHEVGHNWFYGILASNERDYPWMDEGMNSYYEQRYTAKYYPGQDKLGDMLPDGLSRFIDADEVEMGHGLYQMQARQHNEQPIHCHSAELTSMNYLLSGYTRPADVLWYLCNYLGEKNYDVIMQKYYEEWKFKHPQPEDFRKVFEGSVDKDLSWFFDDLLMTTKQMDYALKSVKGTTATIQNKGEIAAPYSISIIKDDKITKTFWYKGFEGEKAVNITTEDYDEVVIDAIKVMPDVNRRNNGQKRNLEIKLLGGIENEDKKTLYATPLIGGNAYDGFMLGAALYNVVLPSKKFELSFAPMFGFASKEAVGMADLSYRIYPRQGAIKRITLGLGARTFHYNNYRGSNPAIPNYLERYYRLVPRVNVELRKKRPRSPVSQNIEARLVQVLQEKADLFVYDFPDKPLAYGGNDLSSRLLAQLVYKYENKNTINPFSLTAGLEVYPDGLDESDPFDRDNTHVKLSLEGKYRYVYAKGGKGLSLRLFSGTFLYNANPDFGRNTFNLVTQGFRDVNFNDYYFGRSESEGIWSQQVQPIDGGFKTPTLNSTYGTSNAYVFALNVKADLPIRLPLNLPLKPYFDIGYFKNTAPAVDPGPGDEILYNLGVAIEFGDGLVGVYLPLISNEKLSNELKSRGNFLKQIGFTVNINRANPFDLIRGVSF